MMSDDYLNIPQPVKDLIDWNYGGPEFGKREELAAHLLIAGAHNYNATKASQHVAYFATGGRQVSLLGRVTVWPVEMDNFYKEVSA